VTKLFTQRQTAGNPGYANLGRAARTIVSWRVHQGFRQVLRFRGCSKTAGGSYGKVLEVGEWPGTRG